jgi:hypothetical protein
LSYSNVNFYGSEFQSVNFVKTTGDCCSLCTSKKLCMAWTYESASQTCYLKSDPGSFPL